MRWAIGIAIVLGTAYSACALPFDTPDSDPLIVSSEQFDIFVTDGRTSPYTLSWRPVVPGSEKVTIDNQAADLAGTTFRMAPDTGTLELNGAPSQTIIRVDYRIDPATAKRNPAPFTLPLSFDLADTGWANAKMDLVYNDEDVSSAADPSGLLVGLGFGADLSQKTGLKLPGTINADFFTRTKPDNADDTSGFSDRSAMRISGDVTMGELGLSLGLSRAGESFADAKDKGMAQGYETKSVGARYTSDRAEVTSSIVQREDIREETAGAQRLDQSHQVGYALGGGARVGVSHNETVLENPQGELTGKDTKDVLTLAQDIAGLGSLSVRREWSESALDPKKDTTVSTYGVCASPAPSWSMIATITERESVATGPAQTQDIGLTYSPGGRLHGTVKLRRDESKDKVGAQFATGVTYDVGAGTTVTSGMSRVYSDERSTDLYDVTVHAKPVGAVDFTGAYAMRKLEMPGMEEDFERSVDMSVKLALPANLSLSTAYALRPRDNQGVFQPLERQSASLGWRIGSLDLSGGFTLHRRQDTEVDSFKREVTLGYRMGESARITLGLAQGVDNRSWTDPRCGTDTRTWSMGFSRQYAADKTFSMKGYWTDRINRADSTYDPDYRVELNAGFKF